MNKLFGVHQQTLDFSADESEVNFIGHTVIDARQIYSKNHNKSEFEIEITSSIDDSVTLLGILNRALATVINDVKINPENFAQILIETCNEIESSNNYETVNLTKKVPLAEELDLVGTRYDDFPFDDDIPFSEPIDDTFDDEEQNKP